MKDLNSETSDPAYDSLSGSQMPQLMMRLSGRISQNWFGGKRMADDLQYKQKQENVSTEK